MKTEEENLTAKSPAEASAAETKPASVSSPPAKTSNSAGRRKAFTIFFVVIAVLAVLGVIYWLYERQFEETDDAQVEAHLNPISSRVDGTIIRVYVDDNQHVRTGDPLVDLDPRDFKVALDQAVAQLAQAKGMVIAQQPNVPITQVENLTNISTAQADVDNAKAGLAAAEKDVDVAKAKLEQSQADNARAQADLSRYKLLISKQEVSQQEFDQVAATAKSQEAVVAANEASLASANAIVAQRRAQLDEANNRLDLYQRNAPRQLAIRRATVISQQANAETAQAQVELAQLKLNYTKIAAPVEGIVMKRSAEVGAHITAGQELLTIAQVSDVWVTANFKETQLGRIRPGQAATIHVDALNRDFDGYVLDVAGSTGAVSSVLPPENATGNYVKVVQRIPVRILFKAGQKALDMLRPGMSVEPSVRIG
jgi:membrane fusion protein (multidrug efflux system)